MSLSNDEIYLDLLLSNTLQTDSNHRVAVSFMQNQSLPIIKSTTGYHLSIIRFALNTETLPIFIPAMQSRNTTTYSITMECNGKQFQQYMEFEPQNLSPSDPDEYYYVYNYQFLMYLVNQCFISCLAGLKTVTSTPTNVSPTISFDSTSEKCAVNFDSNYYGYNETNKISIYMNYAMFALFASLPASIINRNSLGMDYQLNNKISQNRNVLEQDFGTVSLWNPVSSVIFTSNLIPVYQSQTPPIQIFTNGKLLNNSSTSNSLSILTDFIGNDLTFVPYIQFAPAVYRYISLKPSQEIKNIDLHVYWQNKNNGVLKPLYMGVNGSASVKLLFSRM